MRDRIYLSSPHMSGKEMGYIQEAFDTNWVAPLGKNVEMFEKEMCAYIGRPYAVALSAGTAAIHLGLKYLGVERGDVVFCSSFTFSGSCNPAAYLGAKLVFIDCDRESYNMSPAALEKAYEQYPDPKAVIIVNLYGNPAEFDELLAITRKHGTPVLEDSAESLGASYKGVKTGNFGDILAGYYAKRLGLPVSRLIVASDKNNVLFDFLTTGTYDRKRPFFTTTSPSMDILISSNLERMLYYAADGDCELVAELMAGLSREGVYTVPDRVMDKIRSVFSCGRADDEGVLRVARVGADGVEVAHQVILHHLLDRAADAAVEDADVHVGEAGHVVKPDVGMIVSAVRDAVA